LSFPVVGFRPTLLGGLILLALSFLPTSAVAQTWEVVGMVIDAQRGEPITGVEISTVSGKLLGTTNSKGRFAVTVNNRNTLLFFRRQAYNDLELELGTLSELIDIEVVLDPSATELAEKTVTDTVILLKRDEKKQTIAELELMQGMRIDLNDHLRQLPGVSGMTEFSKDISVYGSRTQDVTQYLGQSRIPNMRHLDIGFPGNQSVVNPRLLKSVTLADNLAAGPVNQGNASALVFDLQDGDPEYLHADMVLGTINREFNLSGYWNQRTMLISGRYLDSDFLRNLGLKFYTDPKEARIRNGGNTCTGKCQDLETPFSLVTGDLFISTFKRDTASGAFGRHTVVALSDEYRVEQDVGRSNEEAKAQTLVDGFQDAWMYAYERVSPTANGERQLGFSLLRRNQNDANRDTLPPFSNTSAADAPPWYVREGTEVKNLLGDWSQVDWQGIGSWQEDLAVRPFGARTSLGGELEYDRQLRNLEYTGKGTVKDTLERDLALMNALLRLNWALGSGRKIDAALGFNAGYDGLSMGEESGAVTPWPLATLRYTQPLVGYLEGYGEAGMRQSVSLEPTGYNRVTAYATPSGELKVGVDKAKGEKFRFTSALYARLYRDPHLPTPNVFWNYAETQKSDYAYVRGVTGTATFLPSHHLGMFVNATWADGDYHLEDGNYLPWESNRTLDLVGNIRILPRRDSLLSFIATYTVSDGVPMYEYTGLWNGDDDTPTLRRTIAVSRDFPTVSRQRLDMRINLDLKSKWKPLDGMRFFFEADNIFAEMEGTGAEWLGGANQRQRGWSRANPEGDLVPVITRGLGLFIFFGVEARFSL